MKPIILLLFSCIASLSSSTAAVFKVSKEWKADAATALELSAREQDFKVEVWDKDIVHIDFVLETNNSDIDEDDFKKGLKISAERTGNKLSITSSMDMGSSSIWAWIFNDKKCKSNCALKNTIYLPKNLASATFTFNYCNLKIGEINMPLKITANYGEVAVLKNKNKTVLNTTYSDVNFGDISNLKVSSSYSDFILNIIDTLNMAATYGDIKLSACDQLQSLSLSYSDISINKVGFVKISSTYSEAKINHVAQEVNATLTYSDLSLNSLAKNITGIGISGVYADCAVKINPEFPLNVSVTGIDNDVHVKNPQIITTKHSENLNTIDVSLKTKSAGATSPLIKFSGKRSDITIY